MVTVKIAECDTIFSQCTNMIILLIYMAAAIKFIDY
jgi:hypothetical protein